VPNTQHCLCCWARFLVCPGQTPTLPLVKTCSGGTSLLHQVQARLCIAAPPHLCWPVWIGPWALWAESSGRRAAVIKRTALPFHGRACAGEFDCGGSCPNTITRVQQPQAEQHRTF
jgi:hypothetical protein